MYIKLSNHQQIFFSIAQMSSLAAQLAGIHANNNATILDKSKRKKVHSVSLVFDSKEAVTQDFETIYSVCLEGFRELETIDRRFSMFASSLFSETSIRFDRMVQHDDRENALNAAVNKFFMLVANYLHLRPALLALEWLVRRFHVQLHNAEQFLLCALPWYDTPAFVRVLDVLPQNGIPALFSFLGPAKASLHSPSKNALVRVLSKDKQLFDLLNSYVLECVQTEMAYSRQLVFWSSMSIYTIMAFKETNDPEVVDRVLPVISKLLSSPLAAPQVAAYMVLTVLCSQYPLADDISAAAIATIVSSWHKTTVSQGLSCISQLVRYSTSAKEPFPKQVWDELDKIQNLTQQVLTLGKSHQINAFIVKWVVSGLEYETVGHIPQVNTVLSELTVDPEALASVLEALFQFIKKNLVDPQSLDACVNIIETNIDSDAFKTALNAASTSVDKLELHLGVSITRPEAEHMDEDVVMSDPKVSETSFDGVTREAIIEESENLEMSSRQSFLDGEPFTDLANLWIKASAISTFTPSELAQLICISPQAEPSFFAAIALGPYPVVSRVAAAKMLQSRIENTESQDFQGLLVVLLSLLSDKERSIREPAAASIRFIGEHPPAKNTNIWGYETLYGAVSSDLVWLSRQDQKVIYKFLLSHLHECILDPEQILAISSSLVNKSAAFSELVAVNAAYSPVVSITSFALTVLSNRKLKTPVAGLSPLFESYLKNRNTVWSERAATARISLSDIDSAVCGSVSGADPVGILFLQNALKSGDNEISQAAGQRILTLWRNKQLKADAENTFLSTLFSIASDERSSHDPTDLLSALPLSTDNFSVLLSQSQLQSTSTATADVRRRHRRSSASLSLNPGTVAAVAQSHLHRLTLVLELLDSKTDDISEPTALFSPLFSLLDELAVLGNESNLPVLYTQELLANCLIHLVEKVNANVSSGARVPDLSSVRVDVTVSCIRTSQSPQVQNRLLLLIAALASLCPDIVLHSVMPIFTFMGATTVRLDNDYSAHVIEQTISKVVPALVACGDKQNEIEIALLSFVAAFPHVPRHRRNKLYSALIKTLGPEESLYKFLLLLALKFAEARTRKRSSDAKALVHFTTTFLRSYSISQQLLSLEQFLEYLAEAKIREENSDSSSSAMESGKDNIPVSLFGQDGLSPHMKPFLFEFLTLSVGNDQTISGTRPLRVQIAHAGAFSDENLGHCTRMIDLLLENQTGAGSRDASFDLLSKCLELLPVAKFVEVVTPLVHSASSTLVKERSLALIASKFEYELASDISAQQAALSTLNMLEATLGSTGGLLAGTLDDIDLLVVKYGRYFEPERLLKLLDVLAGPYGLLNEDTHVLVSAVCCINSACQHLGARMIGHFSRILPILFSKCEHVIQENSTDEKSIMLQYATFALVSGLIQRIPSFMGSVSKRVMELVLMSKIDRGPLENLMALIVEKIDAQTVMGAFISTWDNAVQGGLPAIDLFLRHFDSVIEQSPKKDIAAKASPLITLLLRCFGVRAVGRFNPNEVNHIESRVVSSGVAVVLKLNDKVFRSLFVRMARWAFEGESAGVASMAEPLRHVVFLKFLVRLLGDLKSIVTNYFGYVLEPITKILATESDDGYGVHDLTRKLIYQSLILSFASDHDDFWQSPSRFDLILDGLLVKLDQEHTIHGALLVKALVGLAETCSSQQHRKNINDGLAARVVPSCSSPTKIWAIKTLSSLYTKLGEEWIAVLPQFVPLIAELLDDDDEQVEMEVRKKLVPVIEDVLGESLDKYLS